MLLMLYKHSLIPLNINCFSFTQSDLKDNEGETPLDKVMAKYPFEDESLINLAYSLVKRGCGCEKDKGNLLCAGCYWYELDMVKDLVEQHKVDPRGEVTILYRKNFPHSKLSND